MASASTPPDPSSTRSLSALDANALTARLETLVVDTTANAAPDSPVEKDKAGCITTQLQILNLNSIPKLGSARIDGAVSSPDSDIRYDDDIVGSLSIPGSAASMSSLEQDDSTLKGFNNQKSESPPSGVSPDQQTIIVGLHEQTRIISGDGGIAISKYHQHVAEPSEPGVAAVDQTTPPDAGPSPNHDDSEIHPALRASGRIYGLSANDRFPIFYQTDGTARMVSNPLAPADPEGLDSGDFLNVAGPSQGSAHFEVSGSNAVTVPGNVEMLVSDGLITSRVLAKRGWTFTIGPTNEDALTQTPSSMSRNISLEAHGLIVRSDGNEEPLQSDDKKMLLGLCDCLRQVLRLSEIPHTLLIKLIELLDIFLQDEDDERGLTEEMLIDTRLDRLFADLLQLSGQTETIDPLFQEILRKATALEYRLQRRLGQAYWELDQKRATILTNGEGLLHNVFLNTGNEHSNSLWLIRDADTTVKHAGHLKFTPGDWWLNIECAFRDGIVGSPDEKLTNGDYGVTAFSLLTGTEVKGDNPNTVKYIRIGAASDVHLRLMTQFGREIRVIRGYQLLSPYAPKAGVRYDGLYYVRNYSHKFDDADGSVPGSYWSEIILERLPNQPAIDDYAFLIPTPAQLDDWKLYTKILGRHIRARFGERHWHAWFTHEEMGELERESAKMQRETREKYVEFRNMSHRTAS